MTRSILIAAIHILYVTASINLVAQSSPPNVGKDLEKIVFYTSELEFKTALEDYVHKLFISYGAEKIPQEYFLIDLMSLVNKEISRRVGNVKEARDNYFTELNNMLDEIQQLKQRLRNSNMKELEQFVTDLEKRITFTIDESEINYKKKNVFEDALQMLYVAEEMVKLDQLQEPEGDVSFNKKLDDSKKQLLTSFGESSAYSNLGYGKRHSIYDLYSEWKRMDLRKYSLRLADVKLARQSLIKASGREEILRMLNDQLRLAYKHFNKNYYDLADRLLEDVLNTYPIWGIKNLDDVKFYRAECNFALERYLHANNLFVDLIESYPTTSFLPKAYARLVEINYTLENYQRTIQYAEQYLKVATLSDPVYYDIQFLFALAKFQMSDYSQTIESLKTIPADHPYYYFAQYFIGNAYVDNQKYDDAIKHYLLIIEAQKIPESLFHKSLYKIAILEFERGNYFATFTFLDLIPELYPRYDKILNAYAWANYEYEQSKPPEEPRDYIYAKYYARRLLSEFYASPYRMEASSMLAYISQLEKRPSQALTLYRDVYQTKTSKAKVEEYLEERKKFDELYRKSIALKEKAFEKNDTQQYLKAQEMIEKLEIKNLELDLSEVSGIGLAAFREVNSLLSNMGELKRLRQVANANDDFKSLRKIDSLEIHLLSVLEQFPTDLIEKARIVNLFDEYPVSKLIAEEENRSERFFQNRQAIMEEVAEIDIRVAELNGLIKQAESNGDYSLVNNLELEQMKLTELKKYYDNLISVTYMLRPPEDVYPDFVHWGDFGAFGIINVQFFQKQQIQKEMTDLAVTLNKVNKDLEQRRQVIEDQVKKIEAEIRFMTMKSREDERSRQRAERERTFRESYFDNRASETTDEQ